MISANSIVERGAHRGEFADTITLDEDQRHRRRMAMVSDGGIAFLLDLAEDRLLREGDGIRLDDGRVIEVKAKPERLYEVQGRDASHLMTIAWHLGSRHVAAEMREAGVLLRRDEALRETLEGLGAMIVEVEAVFEPTAQPAPRLNGS